jgi:IS5 family transposase
MNNNYRYQSIEKEKKRKEVNKHNQIAHKNNVCHKISSNKQKREFICMTTIH